MSPTDVGFRVERVAAAPIDEESSEGAIRDDEQSQSTMIVRRAPANADNVRTTMRSQSAAAELPASAFDAALVFATASTDPAVGELGLHL